MREGSFVEIEYSGWIKETGELFDTTDEELAKKEGIFNERARYGPIVVVVGAGHVIKGLDDVLKKMDVNEEREVEIVPEDAFGERNPNLVKTLPSAYFLKEGITPRVGMPFMLPNGIEGRIISVSAGRVRVDFNNPLAGKKVVYRVKILREIKDAKEKLESLFVYHTFMPREGYEIIVKDSTGVIKTKVSLGDAIERRIKEEASKYIPEIKDVIFEKLDENQEKKSKKSKEKKESTKT